METSYLLQDFVSMDRIKYRRMWAVYIAICIIYEEEHPDVWDGQFSVQKKEIQFVAIGIDHWGTGQC